jgi:hypothetical protein
VLALLSGLPVLAQPETKFTIPGSHFAVANGSHGKFTPVGEGVRLEAILRDPLFVVFTFKGNPANRFEATQVVVHFRASSARLVSVGLHDPQSGEVLNASTDASGDRVSAVVYSPSSSANAWKIPATKVPKTIAAGTIIRLGISNDCGFEGCPTAAAVELIEVEVFYKNPALKLPTPSTTVNPNSAGGARVTVPAGAPKEPVKALGRINVGLLKNVSGKCVGTANMGSMENGTPLVIWDCHGNPDQQWTLTSETLLKNVSGKCVGTANMGSMENGTPLVIWDCHGNPDQQWTLTSETLLKNVSGKCVGTANMGSMENGTQLIIWDCHGNPDQRWKTTSLASNK